VPTTVFKPDRPGTTIKFIGQALPLTLPSLGSIVAVPLVHDWGPKNEPVLVTSPLEFDAQYSSSDTAGRRAVTMAFNGMGALGGGAGGVVAVRMVGSTGAKATLTLTNATPATGLTLTAKYEGTFAHRLTVSVADYPGDTAREVLTIYLDGNQIERYIYANAGITDLAAQINAQSNLVTAVANVGGVALAVTTPGSPPAMTGGNDGTTLTGTEWTAALTALEFERFSVLAPYNLTDSTIQTATLAWVRAMETANRPVRWITGGLAAETVTTAVTRSTSLADPHVINLGVGTYHDELLDRDLSTAELVPRIAGALVALGDERALTFARIPGLTTVADTAPDNAEIIDLIRGGVTTFSRATAPDADIKVEKGLTTFTNRADAARPYEIFSDPRLVGVMDSYIREMKEWGDMTIIGRPVNQSSRDAVQMQGRKLQDDLEERGLVVAGTSFIDVKDTSNDPLLRDSIPYDFGWQFAHTTNYVFGNGRVI